MRVALLSNLKHRAVRFNQVGEKPRGRSCLQVLSNYSFGCSRLFYSGRLVCTVERSDWRGTFRLPDNDRASRVIRPTPTLVKGARDHWTHTDLTVRLHILLKHIYNNVTRLTVMVEFYGIFIVNGRNLQLLILVRQVAGGVAGVVAAGEIARVPYAAAGVKDHCVSCSGTDRAFPDRHLARICGCDRASLIIVIHYGRRATAAI